MYKNIMIPVDLRHVDQMEKALAVAADLSRLYGANCHIVGVGQSSPSEVARSPDEYAKKLAVFAADRSGLLGIVFKPHAEISHDPTVDLNSVLTRRADEIGVDLIVMASHVPGLSEYVFSSNAGYLAAHAHVSVLVVR